jgi:hypothetical protein
MVARMFFSKKRTGLLIRTLLCCRFFLTIVADNDLRSPKTVHFAKTRVLMVEDDCIIRDLVKSFYDKYGFDLIEAVNGQEAVAWLAPALLT